MKLVNAETLAAGMREAGVKWPASWTDEDLAWVVRQVLAAIPPDPRLDALQRYAPGFGGRMLPAEDGRWIRYDDLRDALAAFEPLVVEHFAKPDDLPEGYDYETEGLGGT